MLPLASLGKDTFGLNLLVEPTQHTLEGFAFGQDYVWQAPLLSEQ